MKTIEELRRENENLQKQLEQKRALLEVARKRNELLNERRELLRSNLNAKYPGLKVFAQKSKVMGKKAGVGLYKWARRIAEAENKAQRRTPSRRVVRHKTRKRR